MTPTHFMIEYWKLYESYMQRKEHLIEAATTLYSLLVFALLLQRNEVWRNHTVALIAFPLLVAVVLVGFVKWQFGLWSKGARYCNASQTVAARWLADVPAADALVAKEFEGVELPNGLKVEIEEREKRWKSRSGCERFCASKFELLVYGLFGVWVVALALRALMAWPSSLPWLPGPRL
jgi:hypothetical protein